MYPEHKGRHVDQDKVNNEKEIPTFFELKGKGHTLTQRFRASYPILQELLDSPQYLWVSIFSATNYRR
jgi:hypothetical protein